MNSKIITDQLNRKIQINFPPKRIISVVPSQTELLFDLGLNEEVVGITKFCIHPNEWFKSKERVGGTKNLNIEKIKSLNPDLIIANKEENTKEQIEELAKHFPVWISDIYVLEDAISMIRMLGEIVSKLKEADSIANKVQTAFSKLKPIKAKKKLAYFIWRDPWMLAGNHTFIHDLIAKLGFENIALSLTGRYPEINAAKLKELNPDIIFLSSEPYPFCEKHYLELLEVCPNAQIKLVDGELFSWYGSRLLNSVNYFQEILIDL